MFGTGLNLGRLFGVRIELDGSVILIFLLLLFNLGAGVFPAWHPQWSAGLRWTTAAAAAVLFLGSILVHELSHALVARAQHTPVRSIRLFLFGGVADIEHEPESPKAEALMAGVGPAVSIGLGVLFGLLASAITPVLDDARRVVGVVHAADVRRIPRDAWPVTRVGEIATPLAQLPAVSPRDGAFAALRELGRRDADELLVADGGQIIGFIARNDIARWLELQAEDEVSAGRMRRAAGSV